MPPGKGIWGRLTSTVPAPRPGSPAWPLWNQVTKLNVRLWRASGGRLFGRYDRAPMCVLHHRGARTGEPRETPLVYMPDGDRIVIVASMGGIPKHPAWFHNVKANPDVVIETPGSRREMTARVAGEAERAELWPRLLQVWPAWEAYQERTSRRIPVIVCEPR